ncbi:metallophosphoesterase [Pseudodonghicola flavimaris]|uniref:Metallophosphoesterase n=1 Tax=Pseudodonghicola flavimaris TaxID=3050036 RepID=A0ABT7EZU1_9RHOB|nr:metallophosphoesterase [Pseudodonghicola flavimaris]MDK3017759.1 metallophosphoesterase [Pseudodonghicola flavimaris]
MPLGPWLRRLRGGRDPGPVTQMPPVSPDRPFYAVGDIHGRSDLLERLLERLDPRLPLVFLGDYVDRGEDSATVLRRLQALSADPDRTVICLMGNHEDMLLQFLDTPEERARSWLRNGGLQTLAAFGVAGVTERSSGARAARAAEELATAMGGPLVDWLRQRPVLWQSGNVVAVHAGADPQRAMTAQTRRALLWGHPEMGAIARSDGLWLVHGHRIVSDPVAAHGVVSVDTGAYATGRLTAAHIAPGQVSFLTAV